MQKCSPKLLSLDNLSSITSWMLKGILIALFIFSTFIGQFPLNITVLVAVFISFSPVFVSRRYDIHFPRVVDVTITIALLLDIVGRVFKLYHTTDWWWWDIMTHMIGSITVSVLAFYLIFSLFIFKKIKISYWMMGVFIFSFTMMIGSLWEVSEFYFDMFTGYNTFVNGANSVRDMLFDAVGGAIVAMLGVCYTKHVVHKKNIFKRLFS